MECFFIFFGPGVGGEKKKKKEKNNKGEEGTKI